MKITSKLHAKRPVEDKIGFLNFMLHRAFRIGPDVISSGPPLCGGFEESPLHQRRSFSQCTLRTLATLSGAEGARAREHYTQHLKDFSSLKHEITKEEEKFIAASAHLPICPQSNFG